MLFFLKDINYIWGNRSVILVFHAGLINLNFSEKGMRGRIPSTSAHKAYTDSTFSRVNGALFMILMMQLNSITWDRRLLSLQNGYILCLQYRGLFTKINFQGKMSTVYLNDRNCQCAWRLSLTNFIIFRIKSPGRSGSDNEFSTGNRDVIFISMSLSKLVFSILSRLSMRLTSFFKKFEKSRRKWTYFLRDTKSFH